MMKSVTRRERASSLTAALRPKTCEVCRKRLPQPRKNKAIQGRPRRYCSRACQQKAYSQRKFGNRGSLHALMEDHSTKELRVIVRQEINKALSELGLVSDAPVPSKKPDLRIVEPDEDDG